jgi:hypothetical protein
MSGLRLRDFERPGRAIDRAALFLALLGLGCVARIGPVPADLSQPPDGSGVVFGRFEEVEAAGEPVAGLYTLFGNVFAVQVDESFRDPFEIARAGAVGDFSALLPAGTYRWRSPCSNERVTFAVVSGAVRSIGTLRLQRQAGFGCRVTVHDDVDATITSFRAAHPALGVPIEEHLMIRWHCAGDGCQPIFAPDPR